MLVLLLIGLIEVGRFTALSIRLGNAARAGAQFAVSSGNSTTAYDSPDIANAACNDSGFSCTTSTPKPGTTAAPDTMLVTSGVNCTYSDGTSSSSCVLKPGVQRNMFVHVSTSGTFKPLLKYPVMPNSLPMSLTATMEYAQ